MTSMIERLARPELLDMKAYESARSLTMDGRVFLDANESPTSPLDTFEANRYPEPQPKALVERLSSIYAIKPEHLMIGRGSDEAIDLLVRVFCRAGQDQILICPPTYGMYEISAKIQGAGIVSIPMILDGECSRLNESAILEAVRENVKIVFICSPNNPTGTAFDQDVLIRLVSALENKAIVVVDEAYAEFTGLKSMIDQVEKFQNLVVLRTLSKAWGIAGVRCGVAISQESVMKLLHKVRAPYPLPAPVVTEVLKATDLVHQGLLKDRVHTIVAERDRLANALRSVPGVEMIYPSVTNFILIQFKDPARIMALTKTRGVILRDRSTVKGLGGCVRITVGTVEENNQVIQMIKEANE